MTLLLSVLALTQAQSPRAGQHPKAETQAVQPGPAVDQQELEALRGDVKRMRVLLNQMQVNLAFVATSDSPLKHQFNLNNDMWQIVLGDMERRLQTLQQHKP